MLSEMEASRGFEQKRTSADWCRARMEEGAHLGGCWGIWARNGCELSGRVGNLVFLFKDQRRIYSDNTKEMFQSQHLKEEPPPLESTRPGGDRTSAVT